jgi:hypothetical protein
MSTHLEIGSLFLETLWYSLASRIVDKAILQYKLDSAAADELKAKFLKRGDYFISPK